jgi:hypothetical protein
MHSCEEILLLDRRGCGDLYIGNLKDEVVEDR